MRALALSATCRHSARTLLWSLALFAVGLAQGAELPVRRALLIGINDYALPSIPKLRGAVSDVHMIARILETRYGFEHANVTVLADAQATRAGILDALDDLIDKTRPGDTVYFHYSGHGSQVRDPDGGEEGGLEETIVAQDSRMPGVPDIVDDELAGRFRRLNTRNALLVFDSCHSGTITRSASLVQPRAIAPDDRPELYRGRSTTSRAAVVVEQLPHVLLAAVPADEEALDAEIDGGYYGVFSFSLARSLDANGPDATPQILHQGIKAELNRIQEQLHLHPPEPQLEAPAALMDTAVLALHAGSAKRAVRRAWLETEPVDQTHVRLIGGVAMNARPGSLWALYGADETRFDYGAGLALGIVQSLSGPDAVLKLQTRPWNVPRGARAIAAAPPDESGHLPVRIAGVPPERAVKLLAAIRGRVGGVTSVGDGEFYRLRVENREGTWHVQDAGGIAELQSFADGADAAVAARLAALLRRSARAMALLALSNPASDMKLEVGARTAAGGTRDIVAVSKDYAPVYRARHAGEARSLANSLVIEVQVDRPVYLTVIDVDAEGGVAQLFPNPRQKPGFLPDGLVPPRQVVAIPDSLSPGNAAGFHWDYGPPAGTDTIRVFATADSSTARLIRQSIAKSAAGSRGLEELGEELAESTVRGVHVVADEDPATQSASGAAALSSSAQLAGDWSASTLVIQVHE